MEMKYVVLDMVHFFGTLEFAGESDHIFDRDKDNFRVFCKKKLQPLFRCAEWEKCCGRNSCAGWRKAFQVRVESKTCQSKIIRQRLRNWGYGTYQLCVSSDDIVAVEEK